MTGTATTVDALQGVDVSTALGRLRIRVAGEGPALMFWSSLMMSGRMWAEQAEHFGKRYRVILVDPPGHGDSEPLMRMFSFDECARCVVQILDALKIDKAHFVGNSWGGMIGGTFAAQYPERVGAAVLMNCTASACTLRQKIEYSILSRVLRFVGGVRGPLVIPVIRAFAGPTTLRERPQVVAEIRAAAKRVNASSVYWAIRSVVPARPDQHALVGKIRTPVLVIAGEEDQTFPVAETQAMADSIPGAKFVVLKRTAHLAGLENPAEVNAVIERFLSRAAL
jgi:3-oxoadipate enol-lactonase